MTLSSEISTTSKVTEKSFLAFANNCQQSKAGTTLASQLLLLFSRSVASNSLPPHGLQLARLPCPSPTLRVYSNSCQSSRWWHPTISFSVVPFSSCLQSFPAFSPDSLLWRHLICISPPTSLHGKQMGKKWKQGQTLFSWDPKSLQMVCSHEIKTHLLPGRKAMTNLDSILKSRDTTLPTKVPTVKAMVFPRMDVRVGP